MTRTTALLAGLLALCAAAGLPERADAQQYRQAVRLDTTVAFARDGRVDLSLISGEIVVSSWDRPQARIVARMEDDDEGRIEYLLSGDRIRLRTVPRDDDRHGDVGDARYEITVPVGVEVEANAVNGDITVRGTGAEVEVGTVTGDVIVENVRGRLHAGSVSGDVTATNVQGEARLNAVNGDVRLQGHSGEEVDASTVSGDVILADVRAREVSVKTVSGEVEFAGPLDPNGTYEFNTHSGDVTLTLPATVNATVAVQTFSGELDTDYQVTLRPARTRRERTMEFTLGNGGARITVETFSGNLNLRRADRAPNRE